MQQNKQWEKPGNIEGKSHEGIITQHPGEDRDTDSEDEKEEPGEQVPVPIQDEPIDESSTEQRPVVQQPAGEDSEQIQVLY